MHKAAESVGARGSVSCKIGKHEHEHASRGAHRSGNVEQARVPQCAHQNGMFG